MMPEVVVSPSSSTMMMQSGKTSGGIRLNHTVARQMPGSGDKTCCGRTYYEITDIPGSHVFYP